MELIIMSRNKKADDRLLAARAEGLRAHPPLLLGAKETGSPGA